MNEKLKRLDAFEHFWRGCTLCPLSEQRTKVVNWRGSPDGKVFLVGQAPATEEDARGRPFVGPSGRHLDSLLASAGLGSEHIFFANMVGCKPPDGRAPTIDEMVACRPRLHSMLWMVQPRVVVLLGATASRLAGIHKLAAWRGNVVTLELLLANGKFFTSPAISTYDPSISLGSKDQEQTDRTLILDLQRAKEIAYG